MVSQKAEASISERGEPHHDIMRKMLLKSTSYASKRDSRRTYMFG